MPTGILKVSTPLLERARRALPPEHRIAAVRECDFYQDWMIEGPMMPGGERVVQLLMMLGPDGDGMVLQGTFEPTAVPYEDATWVIERWPSMDAFREAHGIGRV